MNNENNNVVPTPQENNGINISPMPNVDNSQTVQPVPNVFTNQPAQPVNDISVQPVNNVEPVQPVENVVPVQPANEVVSQPTVSESVEQINIGESVNPVPPVQESQVNNVQPTVEQQPIENSQVLNSEEVKVVESKPEEPKNDTISQTVQSFYNEPKKKKSKAVPFLVFIIVLLCLGIVAMYLYYNGYLDKYIGGSTTNNSVEQKDNSKSSTEESNEIKSFLIYSDKKIVDNNQVVTVKSETDKVSFEYNSKSIFTFNGDLGTIDEVYLVGDLIMYTFIGSDGTVGINFIGLDGKEIKSLYNFGTEKLNSMKIKYNHKILVEDNEITIPVAKYGFSCNSSDSNISDNDIVFATYQLKYLGNNSFSDLKVLSSSTKSSICK